jgi:hypothetical protein
MQLLFLFNFGLRFLQSDSCAALAQASAAPDKIYGVNLGSW